MKKFVFLTGQPGIGKTTVLLRSIKALEDMGHRVGGMISHEVRESGVRIGFEIINLINQEKGWLAHVKQGMGPRVGKYTVNLDDLAEVGVKAIDSALAEREIAVIVIDEVGPMELYSTQFKEAVRRTLQDRKPLLGTIHFKARDPLIDFIKSRPEVQIVKVTYENREKIHESVVNMVAEALKGS